ncbi:unnamed protein product [Dicrocoelium dendriticum]|nr:unnamed protein product [Dicrocoelium dendriticum]
MLRLVVFLFLSPISPLELPKGVPFSRSTFYHIGRPFTCIDGSATIAWHKVNDDSCDCSDGSDEPGTPACENGLFFCSDVQYKSVSLSSAFVNDGYCDCCDGSDEYNSTVTCESTCGWSRKLIPKARVFVASRAWDRSCERVAKAQPNADEIAHQTAGVLPRSDRNLMKSRVSHHVRYHALGRRMKTGVPEQDDELTRRSGQSSVKHGRIAKSARRCLEDSVLAAAVREARSIKRNEIEQGHKIVKEYVEKLRVRREEERIKAEKLAEECAQLERLREERMAQEEAKKKLDDEDRDVPEENVQHVLEEEKSTQDTGIPAASAPVDGDTAFVEKPIADYVEQIPASPLDEPPLHGLSDDTYPDPHSVENLSSDDSSHPTDPPAEDPLLKACEKLKTPPTPIDYGPEEAFYMLVDLPDCLKFNSAQYTYEFCAFKEILQSDLAHGSNRISLGQWDSWTYAEDDILKENKYGVMLFKQGLSCWNGPTRSVKVYVHCGPRNEIIAVAEPSRCEYEMHLRTPAACYEDPEVILKRLHPDDPQQSL